MIISGNDDDEDGDDDDDEMNIGRVQEIKPDSGGDDGSSLPPNSEANYLIYNILMSGTPQID